MGSSNLKLLMASNDNRSHITVTFLDVVYTYIHRLADCEFRESCMFSMPDQRLAKMLCSWEAKQGQENYVSVNKLMVLCAKQPENTTLTQVNAKRLINFKRVTLSTQQIYPIKAVPIGMCLYLVCLQLCIDILGTSSMSL